MVDAGRGIHSLLSLFIDGASTGAVALNGPQRSHAWLVPYEGGVVICETAMFDIPISCSPCAFPRCPQLGCDIEAGVAVEAEQEEAVEGVTPRAYTCAVVTCDCGLRGSTICISRDLSKIIVWRKQGSGTVVRRGVPG